MYEGQEYVKPDAQLDEVTPKQDGFELTQALEDEILALPEKDDEGLPPIGYEDEDKQEGPIYPKRKINKHYAQRVLHCSGKRAVEVLEQMREEGKIKTKEDRYAELYPAPEPEV